MIEFCILTYLLTTHMCRELCKDDFKKGLATYDFEVINLRFTTT